MRKNFYVFLLATISLISLFVYPCYADKQISIYLNDSKLDLISDPFIENGRTLVPIRAITEAMLCEVDWNGEVQNITIENEDILLNFTIEEKVINKTDKRSNKESSIILDVPAQIRNSRTYVPLRAISELFGASVDWNDENAGMSVIMIEYPQMYGDIVEFEDDAIEFIVRKQLYSIDKDDEIRTMQLRSITELDASVLPKNIKVDCLNDIVMFPNLTRLSVENQNIKDCSPIAMCEKLSVIDLTGNDIRDVSPLMKLNNVEILHFPYGEFSFYEGSPQTYKKHFKAYEQLTDIIWDLTDALKNNNISDYEKVKTIHDYMINNADYNYGFESDYTSDIYMFLVEESGYCSVYSGTFKYLCELVGVECLVVSGEAKGITSIEETPAWGGHAWNIVKIDGDYYQIDVTWDDPLPGGMLRYDYFLISDSDLEAEGKHKWDSTGYPECSKTYKQ